MKEIKVLVESLQPLKADTSDCGCSPSRRLIGPCQQVGRWHG